MQEDLFDLIDRIYEAALVRELWPATLGTIASRLGGVCATILPFARPSAILSSPGLEQAKAAYSDHWWQFDSITQCFQRAGPSSGLVSDWSLFDPDAVDRDPFYQEFRRPFGMGHFVGVIAGPVPDEQFSLGLHLPYGASSAPDDEMLRGLTLIGRHVVRADGVTRRLESQPEPRSDFVEALLRLDCGIALLDGRGKILLVNRSLETFTRDGLCLVRDELRTARSNDQAALALLIRAAVSTVPTLDGPDLALVSRPSGKRSYVVRGIRIPPSQVERWSHRPLRECHALVLVVDLEQDSYDRTEPALRLFGLTQAEARVAALIATGLSSRQAADALGVSQDTIKTHIRHVFEKLGISKGNELARIVMQLSRLKTIP